MRSRSRRRHREMGASGHDRRRLRSLLKRLQEFPKERPLAPQFRLSSRPTDTPAITIRLMRPPMTRASLALPPVEPPSTGFDHRADGNQRPRSADSACPEPGPARRSTDALPMCQHVRPVAVPSRGRPLGRPRRHHELVEGILERRGLRHITASASPHPTALRTVRVAGVREEVGQRRRGTELVRVLTSLRPQPQTLQRQHAYRSDAGFALLRRINHHRSFSRRTILATSDRLVRPQLRTIQTAPPGSVQAETGRVPSGSDPNRSGRGFP